MRWPRSPVKNRASGAAGDRREEAQLGHAEVLGLVDDDVVERLGIPRAVVLGDRAEDPGFGQETTLRDLPLDGLEEANVGSAGWSHTLRTLSGTDEPQLALSGSGPWLAGGDVHAFGLNTTALPDVRRGVPGAPR